MSNLDFSFKIYILDDSKYMMKLEGLKKSNVVRN